MTDQNFQRASRHSETPIDSSTVPRQLNPGDEAAPGTPGTGEDICPLCHGQGRLMHARCPNCGGSGKIVRGIGGG